VIVKLALVFPVMPVVEALGPSLAPEEARFPGSVVARDPWPASMMLDTGAAPAGTAAVFPVPAAPWLVGGAGVGPAAGGGDGEVERARGQAMLEAVCLARLGELKSQYRNKIRKRERETRDIK
jgi:hypothetical protein